MLKNNITDSIIREFNRRFYIDNDWILRVRVQYNNRVVIGDKVGSLCCGYRRTRVNGVDFYTHRIIWAMHYNQAPLMDLDHKDRDRSNTSIDNLHEVTKTENAKNKSKHRNNTSGIAGVSWHKKLNKWRVDIGVEGKTKYLGIFTTKLAAAYARHAAEQQYGVTQTW